EERDGLVEELGDGFAGIRRRPRVLHLGVAADEPTIGMVGVDGGVAAVEIFDAARKEIEARLREAQTRFRATVPADIASEWRGFLADPTRSLVDAARAADLVVTGRSESATFSGTRWIDIGGLVLSAGRPVILVGDGIKAVKAERIIIAWKDTREARRAVSDALPFLASATDVLAITISEGEAETETAALADLVDWLKRHGVTARSELIDNPEGFIDVLESQARASGADMIVAGGYGHSRMREWLFGGMTRNLLEANTLSRFLSN
ncbi:MAG: universal stress protein, partial [Devosia sp.]